MVLGGRNQIFVSAEVNSHGILLRVGFEGILRRERKGQIFDSDTV